MAGTKESQYVQPVLEGFEAWNIPVSTIEIGSGASMITVVNEALRLLNRFTLAQTEMTHVPNAGTFRYDQAQDILKLYATLSPVYFSIDLRAGEYASAAAAKIRHTVMGWAGWIRDRTEGGDDSLTHIFLTEVAHAVAPYNVGAGDGLTPKDEDAQGHYLLSRAAGLAAIGEHRTARELVNRQTTESYDIAFHHPGWLVRLAHEQRQLGTKEGKQAARVTEALVRKHLSGEAGWLRSIADGKTFIPLPEYDRNKRFQEHLYADQKLYAHLGAAQAYLYLGYHKKGMDVLEAGLAAYDTEYKKDNPTVGAPVEVLTRYALTCLAYEEDSAHVADIIKRITQAVPYGEINEDTLQTKRREHTERILMAQELWKLYRQGDITGAITVLNESDDSRLLTYAREYMHMSKGAGPGAIDIPLARRVAEAKTYADTGDFFMALIRLKRNDDGSLLRITTLDEAISVAGGLVHLSVAMMKAERKAQNEKMRENSGNLVSLPVK
jgi:hypothetical protein